MAGAQLLQFRRLESVFLRNGSAELTLTSKPGIHPKITCFTGTKVPILTLTRLAGVAYITKVKILKLTRLLTQLYKH
jgi:hypothetical protein